jgi:hypothetical protein
MNQVPVKPAPLVERLPNVFLRNLCNDGLGNDRQAFASVGTLQEEIPSVVLVFLNKLQFEAEKFETRTMPTPNMKGKEMIYWIRVSMADKRLATDLERFLRGASKYIDLRVPSTFISAQTELESYRVLAPRTTRKEEPLKTEDLVAEAVESSSDEDSFRFEIVLRRTLSETTSRPTQSPYG